ncbi:TPR repeat protein [Ignavibacterium album JCM 16511]|uniref:TPR repeat protein n=1 Tax=Ignavibacterium album (strain DSM 19864 / JCM 16511 / NBRC 101810 / Mat9-16) TaxID=945713 RepID=I0ALB2_IGNAJ|nr:tetratricopeptide repeat protein [Ignavibacterium album]AFH49769.1 TPR repeat protein [Ignavibacterium album JCM 16511]
MSFIVKYFSVILLIFTLLSCSTSNEVKTFNEIKTSEVNLSSEQRKRIALENFIDGNINFQQGNYALAMNKFETALQFDTSAGLLYTYAKAALFNNKLNFALDASKMAVTLDSTQSDYFDLLSDIYNIGKQKDSSIIVLERALQLFPTNQNFYYKLARLYQDDRPIKAIEMYEKILSLIGPEWNVLFRLVELNNKLNNTDGVIKALKQLLEIDPSNIQLKKSLIENLLLVKRNPEALDILNELIQLYPQDLELIQKKAQILLSENKWQEAYNTLKFVFDDEKINLDAKLEVGYLFFEKSITDSSIKPLAEQIFSKLDKDTSYWAVKIVLGAIALEENNDSLAIENFKYVTENANWNVDAWIRLGALYFDNKKYEEAQKIMRQAIQSFPNNYAVNFILGISLAQQSKNDEAEIYLKKAVSLNPNDLNTLSAYAYTLNQLKKDEQAIYYLNQALAIDPNDVNVIGTLALIYNAQKRFELSDSLYERALQLKPDDPLINNNYAYSLSTRGIQLERALKMVSLSLEKDSLNTAYLDTKGWILFQLKKFDEAKKYISKAVELGTKSAVIIDHLGDVEFKLGNKEKAIELWKEAFQLDPSKKEIEEKINKGEL